MLTNDALALGHESVAGCDPEAPIHNLDVESIAFEVAENLHRRLIRPGLVLMGHCFRTP
jgi:hypothetical protein